MQSKKNDRVRCPTCHKPTDFSAQNLYRPFCCYRCKLIDLGSWASESYKLPSSEIDGQISNETDIDEDQ